MRRFSTKVLVAAMSLAAALSMSFAAGACAEEVVAGSSNPETQVVADETQPDEQTETSEEIDEGPHESPTNELTHIDVELEDFVPAYDLDAARQRLEYGISLQSGTVSFADLLAYAEQYIGLPYVWGGRDVATQGGLDCAGFVEVVYNHFGAGVDKWNTNAAMLYSRHCTPVSFENARPGDLVFFTGTYGSNPNYITHVGIYMGYYNGMYAMLDAGDPIGFDNIFAVDCNSVLFGRMKNVTVTYDTPFHDTPATHWAVRDGWVQKAVEAGLMSGDKITGTNTTSGYFRPDAQITRAEVATVFYRIANPGSTATTNASDYAVSSGAFKDVESRRYYTAAVEWCSEQGIITGDRDEDGNPTGTFRPNDAISRQEFAAMAYRFAQASGVNVSNVDPSAFNAMRETDQVSEYAREAMMWCASKGVITGVNHSGTLYAQPWAAATRAQGAKIFTQLNTWFKH